MPRQYGESDMYHDTLSLRARRKIYRSDISTDDNVSKIYMYMYISQYESTIWKKYIPSKSHISTHASSREKEREREREIHIYVDVRYTCIMFWKISRFTRGRIANRKSTPKSDSFLSTKSRQTQIVGLAFRGACTRRVYTSWKLVRKVMRLRLESTELQTVDIHPKNAMLDYATLISFSVNITRTGPHCIPVRSSRSMLSVLFFLSWLKHTY